MASILLKRFILSISAALLMFTSQALASLADSAAAPTQTCSLSPASVCQGVAPFPRQLDQEQSHYRRLGLQSIGLGDFADWSLLHSKDRHRARQLYRQYVQEIETQLLTDLNFPLTRLQALFDEVKSYLSKVIERQTRLTDEQKSFLKTEILARVQLLRPADYLNLERPGQEAFAVFQNRLCGLAATNENATALARPAAVLLCPGKLIAAKVHAPHNVEAYLWQTLAHELAHHFDYFRFPFWFDRFEACLRAHHSQVLSSSRRLIEITADHWASQALALKLATHPGSARQRQRFWKLATRRFCGLFPSSVHPPAQFRLLMGLTVPGLAQTLSCQVPNQAHCAM